MKDLNELSMEISAVSFMLTALSYQLDNKKGDTLSKSSYETAIWGVTRYLDRLSDDISEIDENFILSEKQDKEHKEIAELLSSIDNAYILDQIKQFTINITKEDSE